MENIGSVSVELTPLTYKIVEKAKITIQGELYQAAALKMFNR